MEQSPEYNSEYWSSGVGRFPRTNQMLSGVLSLATCAVSYALVATRVSRRPYIWGLKHYRGSWRNYEALLIIRETTVVATLFTREEAKPRKPRIAKTSNHVPWSHDPQALKKGLRDEIVLCVDSSIINISLREQRTGTLVRDGFSCVHDSSNDNHDVDQLKEAWASTTLQYNTAQIPMTTTYPQPWCILIGYFRMKICANI